MTVGQHPQHHHMILGSHRPQPRLTKRNDRYRAGVVGVVLLRAGRIEHPNPGRLGRRHVHYLFPGRYQLLGQQVAVSAGRLIAHRRRGNRSAHPNSSRV